MHSNPLRIHMWSGPRNVSTAIMYAFRQRPDTLVVDEPLYAHYLARVEAGHPGADEVIASQERDGNRVIQQLFRGPAPKPVVFFKQMTHHLVELDWDFMAQDRHFLLIRDPRDMLPSLAQVMGQPALNDTGLALHVKLFNHLERIGQTPLVVDSRELLRNPSQVLYALCDALGLRYTDEMLHWPPGPKPEDGVWAKHWYAATHDTTGFAPYRSFQGLMPEELGPLYVQCKPYYDELYAHAIKASEVQE